MKVTKEDFLADCENILPSDELKNNMYLFSLWYDHKGDWEKSHALIQDLNDTNAAAIHAYLHRKEGDIWNADYWYRRAKTVRKDISLEQEWDLLINSLTA